MIEGFGNFQCRGIPDLSVPFCGLFTPMELFCGGLFCHCLVDGFASGRLGQCLLWRSLGPSCPVASLLSLLVDQTSLFCLMAVFHSGRLLQGVRHLGHKPGSHIAGLSSSLGLGLTATLPDGHPPSPGASNFGECEDGVPFPEGSGSSFVQLLAL